jgi:biopolymer transport protein ExbD
MSRRRIGVLRGIASTQSKLDMTPMIDVTFLLLIFFMCTLKFKTLEGKLSAFLPKDVGVTYCPAELVEKIAIRMDVVNAGNKVRAGAASASFTPLDEARRARFIFDESRVIRYHIGAMQTTELEDVETMLRAFHAQDPARPATIDPREGIVTSDVVELLDVAIDVGITEIGFVGSYERE